MTEPRYTVEDIRHVFERVPATDPWESDAVGSLLIHIDRLRAENLTLKAEKEQWEPEWKSQAEANAAGYNQALGEIAQLRAENSRLLSAATELREAQKTYMANRGNDALGRKVAEAAARLDEVLDSLKTRGEK